MFALSASWRDIPEALIERHRLESRVLQRTPEADREIRFSDRDPEPVLPAWVGLELGIYPWGNFGVYHKGQKRQPSRLPKAGWVRVEDLEAAPWQELTPRRWTCPPASGWQTGSGITSGRE